MENSKKPVKSFRDELRQRRPDLDREIRKNNVRRQLALALRSLRKAREMTQKDIEKNSDLAQSAISKLESPLGPLPTLKTIMKYVQACNGHILLSFSAREFNETDVPDSDSQDKDQQPAVSVRFNRISEANPT